MHTSINVKEIKRETMLRATKGKKQLFSQQTFQQASIARASSYPFEHSTHNMTRRKFLTINLYLSKHVLRHHQWKSSIVISSIHKAQKEQLFCHPSHIVSPSLRLFLTSTYKSSLSLISSCSLDILPGVF